MHRRIVYINPLPTLPKCPCNVATFFSVMASHTWTLPRCVPTAKSFPYNKNDNNHHHHQQKQQQQQLTLSDQETEVTLSFSSLRSHNLDTYKQEVNNEQSRQPLVILSFLLACLHEPLFVSSSSLPSPCLTGAQALQRYTRPVDNPLPNRYKHTPALLLSLRKDGPALLTTLT